MSFDVGNYPMIRFTSITLSQMETVESIRIKSCSTMYVYTFASLFAWQEHEGYGIYISDDAFLVKHGIRGEDVYLFPCGTEEGKKRLIDALLANCFWSASIPADSDLPPAATIIRIYTIKKSRSRLPARNSKICVIRLISAVHRLYRGQQKR